MKSLADQLKQLGYKESEETKQYNKEKQRKEQQSMNKEIRKANEKSRIIEEREERKKRLNAMPKDKVFNIMALQDKNKEYTITAYIDNISHDNYESGVIIVSINCVHITINGKLYVADHTHLRSDKIKINKNWKIGDKIVFTAKLERYTHSTKKKYELVNIF